MKIYKKEIAIEQLEASIELFFQDKYPSLFNLDKNKLDEINKIKNEMNIELSKEKIYSLFFK